MRNSKFYLIFIILLAWPMLSCHGTDHLQRPGVGMSNQLINNMPAISIKLQKSKTFAFGALINLGTNDTRGGYGAGLKIYRIIFAEPNLSFYGSTLVALINRKTAANDDTGFQIDCTLGSEFHFSGLESIGFSFEFGISINKLGDFNIETTGQHIVSAGIHFYI